MMMRHDSVAGDEHNSASPDLTGDLDRLGEAYAALLDEADYWEPAETPQLVAETLAG